MSKRTFRIKSATFGIYHHDCQTSESSEKFPGITLKQLSPVVYLSKKNSKLDYSLIWEVEANSPSELEEYLQYVKNDPRTIRLRILEKGRNNALILLRFLGTSSTYGTIISNKVTLTSLARAKEGFETYSIISEKPNFVKKMLEELSCIGQVKILRVSDFDPKKDLFVPSITEKQAEALKIALINNYYSWPKGTTLERLASIAKISRRSMQERLRRAEAKLLPVLLKDYLKKKL
ncbi:MAG: helix-turn-helix domain-containing protein [Candidatus Anstonellaceae archaeon]